MSGLQFFNRKLLLSVTVGACLAGAFGVAQTADAPKSTATTNTVAAPAFKPVKPLWTELSPMQQEALAALKDTWDTLDLPHKRKWLTISDKYASMSAPERARFQSNLREWLTLTPEQRRIARETSSRVKHLDSEQKSAHWQQYQQLPDDQKQELAASASAHARVANLPAPKTQVTKVPPLKPLPGKTPLTTAAAPANQPTTPAAAAPAANAASAPLTPALPAPGTASSSDTTPAATPAK